MKIANTLQDHKILRGVSLSKCKDKNKKQNFNQTNQAVPSVFPIRYIF